MKIKYLLFQKRREDLSLAQYKERCLAQKANLTEKLSKKNGVVKIVANIAVARDSKVELPIDGVIELYLDPEIGIPRGDTPLPKSLAYALDLLRKEEPNFVDPVRGFIDQCTRKKFETFMEENLFLDKGVENPTTKLIGFSRRRPGLTLEQYKDYWLNRHIIPVRNVAAHNPGMTKVFVNIVIPTRNGCNLTMDGMLQVYQDTDVVKQGQPSEELRQATIALRKDEPNFQDPFPIYGFIDPITAGRLRFLTEEHVLFEKGS
jgi:hypothetical protein